MPKIAEYNYPEKLLPDYHHALFQLIVGVEQNHPEQNLKQYAKNLRDLAGKAFVEYKEQ